MKNLKRISFTGLLFMLLSQAVYAQLTQTIRGQVVDMATQMPLTGATIQIAGSGKGATTDADGNFRLEQVPTGRVSLQVSYLGYDPSLLPQLQVISSKELVLAIELKESAQTLNEVVVRGGRRKDLPQNDMAALSARTFSVEEARRYAGGVDDPARMAANFAGVTSVSTESNAIIIRGNAPTGVLWRLEDADIPNPSHFYGSSAIPGGGMFTIFSSSMLANSDFYTGAFPSEFGNAVSGVFDMRFRNGNNQRHEFTAQGGMQGVEFAAEGPFKKNYGGSYLFNVRISTMGIVQKFIPQLSSKQTIHYEDVAFKINLPARKAGTFTLWGIGGNSITKREAEEDPTQWTGISEYTDVSYTYLAGAAGATHKQTLNESMYLATTLATTFVHKKEKIDIRRIARPTVGVPYISEKNRDYKLSLSSRLNHRHSANWNSRYGIRLEQLWNNINHQQPDDNDVMQDVSRTKHNTQLLQAHAQTKYAFSEHVSLTGGVNAALLTLNNDFSIEPRGAVEWKINERHSLTVGTGLHSQISPIHLYFMQIPTAGGGFATPNRNLGMTRSWHNVIGYNWTINPNLRLKVEPYFQYLYNVPVLEGSTFSSINFTTIPPLFDAPFVDNGKGRNIGIDFTLERFLQDGYYYMATVSLFDSRYRDNLGDWHNTQFNTHFMINLLGGKEFIFRRKNGRDCVLGLNARVSLTKSRPFSPVDMPATLAEQDIVLDESRPFNQYKNGIEPVSDISVTYRVNYPRCSGTIALQVKNVVGKQYFDRTFNIVTQQVEDVYFDSMIPFISYKIEF